jgi:hypothetical protein
MADDIDPRIAQWPGGPLRVYDRQLGAVMTGEKNEAGADLIDFTLVTEFRQRMKAKPFGPGLALLEDSGSEVAPGLLVDVDVRGGRLQVVAIRSTEDGPELTQTVLRSIGSPREILRKIADRLVVRLEIDKRGRVIGISPAYAPQYPRDFRSLEERTADVRPVIERATRKPGRPPLPDEDLRRVARVVSEARARRERIDKAVAEEFGITWGAAKKRIRIAQERGFLGKEQER